MEGVFSLEESLKSIRADSWVGGKKSFQQKGGRHSVNERFGKDCYRKGNSIKRSGPSREQPDSEN